MGIEMKFTGSDGKRYKSLDDMLAAEAGRVVDDHLAAIKRAIESQRCPVHHQYATASMRRSGDRVTYDIEGCCDRLTARAQSAASRVGGS